VVSCINCGGNHTGYTAVHNGPADRINIFTWWEFLDAYLNHKDWIKPWVVFDEAHTDLPAYQNLVNGLKKIGDRKKRGFGILEVSATFSDLPTSKKLDGQMTDYYVTDFKKLLVAHPEIFEKTTIIFCDDITKLNLKP
jgi:hypothetical protein